MNDIYDRIKALEKNQEQLIRVRINNSIRVDHTDFESMYLYKFDCHDCHETFKQVYYLNNDDLACNIYESCPTVGCSNGKVKGVLK